MTPAPAGRASQRRRPARRRPRPAGPWQGQTFTVTIEAVAHGGHCVARHDGRVLFVRHTLPGETVRALVVDDPGGSFCRADAVEVLVPAADRVQPPCRAAGPGRCGGCDFQHVEPAAQRRLKAAVVAEQLARLGGLPDVAVTVESLGPALGWRTRMQFAVGSDGRAGLRRHRSHQLELIADCPIAAPGIDASAILAQRWADTATVDVVTDADGERAVLRRDDRGRAVEARGADRVIERAAGREWSLHPTAFWQVHPAAAATFTSVVADFLAVTPGERVLDLYSGVGLFGAALADGVGPTGSVVCVESDPVAVRAARTALADLGWVQIRSARVDAELVAGSDADVVVLDPPRAGAGRAIVTALVELAPRAVAYVSCDPAALGRDVGTFTAAGWRLVALRAFDAFPMTGHVECIALLVPPEPALASAEPSSAADLPPAPASDEPPSASAADEPSPLEAAGPPSPAAGPPSPEAGPPSPAAAEPSAP